MYNPFISDGLHFYQMRALVAMLCASILIMAIFPSYNSFADKPSDKAKPFTVSVSSLKEPKSVKLPDGKTAERIVHIFYKEGFGHKDEQAKSSPAGKGSKGNTCYTYLSQGAKWRIAEPYIVDPVNGDGYATSIVAQQLKEGVATWETTAGYDIFGEQSEGVANRITGSMDERNEIYFADLDEQGVIAVTIVWGVFSGPPSQKKLVEFDMIFEDPDFVWGNAGSTNELALGNTNIMDLLDIATHELGHAGGMGHPSNSCTQETMYAYATEGETKKRTLNAGDILGIQQLYP